MAHGTARTRSIKRKERSGAGASWQRLYKLKRWQDIRQAQFAAQPLCERCLAKSPQERNAATVCHHVHRHGGDPIIFFGGPFQSLCQACHDGEVQQEEKLGYSLQRDASGRAIDPRHPANMSYDQRTYSIPHSMRPSRVLVHVVVGPPASGKTTFCRYHAKCDDVIIDLDDIAEALGAPRYGAWDGVRKQALQRRDEILRSLADRTSGEAWLIVSAPTDDERTQWVKALGNAVLHVMDTDYATCRDRIMAAPERKAYRGRLCSVLDDYAAIRRRIGKP